LYLQMSNNTALLLGNGHITTAKKDY